MQFGAIPDGTSAGQKDGNLTVSYNAYPSSANPTDLVANFSGQVATANSAVFQTPSSGTAGSSFQGTWPNLAIAQNTTTNNTITYTITNTGNDAATNFIVTLPNAPSGWNTPNTTCPTTTGTNLAKDASCTVTITPVTSTATTITATNMTIGMAWSDQDSPSGETQNMQLPLPLVEVYAPAAIAITTNPASNVSVAPGGSFTMTATLTGGYNLAAQTIQAALTTGTSGDISFGNNDCALNSQNGYSCTITVNAAANATAATGNVVTLSNTTTPALAPNPATVTFNIMNPKKIIFVTTNFYDGNLGGLAGADTKCQEAAVAQEMPAGQYKALLIGSSATIVGVKYYWKNLNIEIGEATTGDLTYISSTNTTTNDLTNAIDFTDFQVWTGANGVDCGDWYTNDFHSAGYYGISAYKSRGYIFSGTNACSFENHLYCVQQ